MYRLSAVIGGVIGGVIGAAVWAAIAAFTGYEVGWIAWGIGALVGFGVAAGNKGEGSVAAGVLAVIISTMSIVGGKYAAVQLMLGDEGEFVEAFVASLENDELVVSYIADGVAQEFTEDGRPVNWPPGVVPSQATTRVEYPPDVWEIAQSRWDGLSPEEREEFRSALEAELRGNLEASMSEIRGAIAEEGFLTSFGLMDLLFFGLAIVTAYKMGVAGSGRSAPEPEPQSDDASSAL